MAASCIEHWGYIDKKGYGRMRDPKTGLPGRGAYRIAYESAYGPIAKGLDIHHICENPACVNPEHLQALTRAEHVKLHAAVQTRCANGHEYNSENTYIRPTGQRDCRACIRERVRQYRLRRLEEA